jgi:hypothetical protein
VQRFYKFIVVFSLLTGYRAVGQQAQLPLRGGKITSLTGKQINIPLLLSKTVPPSRQSLPLSSPVFLYRDITPDFYAKHLAFFCRTELQLEKKFNLPLRFRLGSLDYTNKLEGKK